MRRRATIVLHWSTAALLLFVLAAGPGKVTLLDWGYVLSAAVMAGLAAVFGVMNGPGPKLEGAFRVAHPWMSRGLYLLLGWSALSLGAERLGWALPGPQARTALLVVLSAAMIHAVFNLWRHTALGDGALRRISPSLFHKIL
jgi:cytochrome b561